MTTTTEALRLAREALRVRDTYGCWSQEADAMIERMRSALAAIDAAPIVTGGSPEHLLQDQDRGLSRWLADKPDARMHAREAAAAIAAPSVEPVAQRWIAVTERMPQYDDQRRIVCYCDGYDYGGTSIITLKASEFYEHGEGDGEPGNRESRTVSHWIAEDDLVRWITRATPQAQPAASVEPWRKVVGAVARGLDQCATNAPDDTHTASMREAAAKLMRLLTAPQAQSAATALRAPQSCPTHKTNCGARVICRRCGEVWPAGAERACVRAEKLLARAHGITPQEPT